MAVLSGAARLEAWAEFMRENMEGLGLTKADLRAAIDATDQWIDDEAAAYNTALPVAARTALSASQKARMFACIALRRFS